MWSLETVMIYKHSLEKQIMLLKSAYIYLRHKKTNIIKLFTITFTYNEHPKVLFFYKVQTCYSKNGKIINWLKILI